MNRLASIIVDKMFERQAELDEEFMAESGKLKFSFKPKCLT